MHFCWFAGVGRRATRPSQIEEEGGLHNGFQVYDYAVKQDLGSSSTSQKHYNTPSKELERIPCAALCLTSLRFKLFAWL